MLKGTTTLPSAVRINLLLPLPHFYWVLKQQAILWKPSSINIFKMKFCTEVNTKFKITATNEN